LAEIESGAHVAKPDKQTATLFDSILSRSAIAGSEDPSIVITLERV